MKRTDFSYDLPERLIAKYPTEERSGSRLLVLAGEGNDGNGEGGSVSHRQFRDLPELVREGDLLVFNNTRVIPARVFGQKQSGGKLEVLVERICSDQQVHAHVRASKSPKAGAVILLGDERLSVEVCGREGELFVLRFPAGETALEVLERIGHMPLPPYIDRQDGDSDRQRYQTVYNKKAGAVAAPTAGLHFDQSMLEALKAKGCELGFVTLHVGAGTFQPVRADDIRDHVMHHEYLEVDEVLCQQVRKTRSAGGRVIAVGTTSVRCLETASRHGDIEPFAGDTDIFIYPGYQFRCVDALVTNFHLPESTLIMLVSAFAGQDLTLSAYEQAVEEEYRFFSYGDAMFVTPQNLSIQRQAQSNIEEDKNDA